MIREETGSTMQPTLDTTIQKNFLSDTEKAVLVTILVLVAFMGISANSLVIYVIRHSLGSYMQVPANIFILSQVFADLFTSAATLLFIYHIFSWNWQLVYVYTTFTWFASLGSLFLLTFNRLVSVCDPLKYPAKMTPFRAKILVGFIWSVAVIIALLHMIGYVIHSNSNFFNYGRYYMTILATAVVLSNAYMYRVSRKHSLKIKKQRVQTGIERNRKEDFKSVRTLGLVGGTFLLSCCPLLIIVFLYGNEKESIQFQRNLAYVAPLVILNPIADPIIYYFRSSGLRTFYQRFKRRYRFQITTRNYKVTFANFTYKNRVSISFTNKNQE